MSPHRVPAAAKAIGSSFLGIDGSGAFFAVVVAALGWVLGEVNIVLIVVAAAAVLADITSGALRAFIDPRTTFSRDVLLLGLSKKLLAAHLVVLGLVLDWSLRAGFPDAAKFVEVTMPFTRTALLVFIASEASSVARNVALVLRIPKLFQGALDAMARGGTPLPINAVRAVDSAYAGEEFGRRWIDRIPATTDQAPPPPAPPPE